MNGRQLFWLLLRVVAIGASGALLGSIFDRAWLGVAFALALLAAWNYWRMQRLLRWLGARVKGDAPEFNGVWGEAVAQIERLRRRKDYYKQRLEQLLREFNQSTAAMPDGVVSLNPAGEIAWFNRTAGELLGLGSSDLGLRVETLIRNPEFVYYMRGEARPAGITVRSGRDVEMHLALLLAPYGDGFRLLLVRDVTVQARLDAMRRDFVANASHELRSPLTVITGYLETLHATTEVGSELLVPLDEMRRQATRMNAILKDLLELSSLESTELPIAGEWIDLHAMATQLERDLLARSTRPATIEIYVPSGARLRGDESMIRSAFGNLLNNAANYTPAAGMVRARWWINDDGGHFEVQDTGVGIAPEHLPRLTERFYRADPGRSRATGGSGLGLAIVKHAMQRHEGSLGIESELGQGSRFTCHFPANRVVIRESDAVVEI